MKNFNAKNTKKTSRIRAWMVILLIGILLVGTTSCDNDDDDNTVTPDPEEPAEVASAWVTGFFVGTPQGRIWYMNVSEEIPNEFNASEAVELGLSKSVISYGEHAYVYDLDGKTVTKWAVDRSDLSLSPVGIMSLAATGFNTTSFYPAFISETQAFMTNLTEGLIIEWNPSDMTVTQTYEVEPLISIHPGGRVIEFQNYVKDGKIFMPIGQDGPELCCSINTSEMGATVAVFDVNSKTLQYEKDDRLMATVFRFITDENGDFYVQPIDENSWITEYFDFDPNDAPSPHTVLKFNNDGTFDPNFELNLDDYLDIEVYAEAVLVADNKIVLNYYDSADDQLDPSYEDSRAIFGRTNARTVAVDLTSGEVTEFTALSQYDFVILNNRIDGVNYYIAFSTGESAFDTSHILRQNSVNDYTQLGIYSGTAIQWVGKLWGD
ncbi:MAG: hypothetical protein AAF632_08685 [Bacteroidota bacterium]